MRLISAIPLLFWVGTAAVAHLAHVWALVPPAVTPVSQASEPTAGASAEHATRPATRHLTAHQDLPAPLYLSVPYSGNCQSSSRHREAHSARFHHQILSAARLSANPPPQRV